MTANIKKFKAHPHQCISQEEKVLLVLSCKMKLIKLTLKIIVPLEPTFIVHNITKLTVSCR